MNNKPAGGHLPVGLLLPTHENRFYHYFAFGRTASGCGCFSIRDLVFEIHGCFGDKQGNHSGVWTAKTPGVSHERRGPGNWGNSI